MKKILLAVIAISVTLLLPSCIGLTNISTPHTVALNQGNFKFVKSVNAETLSSYVFGIGGFRNSATEDVVEKLREKADLQPNQALADIRIKLTTKIYLGIVVQRTLTAAASVVEFKDTNTNSFVETDEEVSKLIDVYKEKDAIDTEQIVDANTKEDEDIDLSLREAVFLKLKKIRYSLKNGNVEDMSEIKSEVDRISKWYNSISATYPEIHNILKEIKKLL